MPTPPKPALRGWRWSAVAGYAVVIVMLTLTSRRGTSGALHPNLVPLASITDLVSGDTSRAAAVNNVLGNLLLFAPLAVLLRTLVLRSSLRALAAVAAASITVELVQGLGFPDGRQADVDDVLLNLLGAAAALVLLRAARGGREQTGAHR